MGGISHRAGFVNDGSSEFGGNAPSVYKFTDITDGLRGEGDLNFTADSTINVSDRAGFRDL